jgi:hypothetical protein
MDKCCAQFIVHRDRIKKRPKAVAHTRSHFRSA